MLNVLVNKVTLNLNKDTDVNTINLNLAIPVKISKESTILINKATGKENDVSLGDVTFSEKTSEKIRQVAEDIREELLAQLK